LFVPDPIIDGKNVPFRRHNNGSESSYRRIRKGIRERTGKSETNRETEQFGDLLAILPNLWNEVYRKEILYDVGDLGWSLSSLLMLADEIQANLDAMALLGKNNHKV